MASLNLYKKYQKSDIKNQDGGYKALIYFAPIETFTAIQMPGAATLLGDTKKITTAHTFPVDEGFISLLCKMHSVTSKGQTVGDEGAESMEWSFEASILGDSAVLQEELEGQLNSGNIWLLKDQSCLVAGEFVQFGDSCLQPVVKLEFDGKTTKEGNKEYKLTGTIRGKKYWYSGTLTEKP